MIPERDAKIKLRKFSPVSLEPSRRFRRAC